MKRILFLCVSLGCSLLISREINWKKVKYNFTLESIDVVIPVHRKDLPVLEMCIEGVKRNVKNVRRIIVISEEHFTHNAEWFDERDFPFTKEMIAIEIFKGNKNQAMQFVRHPDTRIGWIFKQIVCLYVPLVIPDVSSNVLILDSDTIFFKPVSFQDEEGNPFFNPGTENHRPYFEHGARLLPGFRRVMSNHSGISHHMLFQRDVIIDLLANIMEYHELEPWVAIARTIDLNHIYKSCMAEYEIYFNYLFLKSDQGKIRPLKWANGRLKDLQRYKNHGFDYASFHHYCR